MLLLLHFAATLYMVGVIWFVQVVHYPLLALVPENAFVAYERAHVTRTGWIVGPPMLLEVGTAAALLYTPVGTRPAFLAAFLLLLIIWLATAIWSVPLHRRLSERYDSAAIRRLVATNWIRTLAWSARAILLAICLCHGGNASALHFP